MKNIRTISRGANGVSLQFISKKSSSEIEYFDSNFNFKSPVKINNNNILDSSYLIEAVTDNITTASGVYTQAEVQQIIDDLIAIKDAMRTSGILKS